MTVTVTAVALCSFLIGMVCGVMLRHALFLFTGREEPPPMRRTLHRIGHALEDRWRLVAIVLVTLSLACNAVVGFRLLAAQQGIDELGDCQRLTTSAAIDLWTEFRKQIADPQGTTDERRRQVLDAIDDYVASLRTLQAVRGPGETTYPPADLCAAVHDLESE